VALAEEVGLTDDPVADIRAPFDVLETGLAWHCRCAVTRLDVPDRLAGGLLAVRQLAAAVGAHEDSLRRVLRLLSDHAIVTMLGAGPGSRLRIFERLLPDDDRPDRAKGSDLAMLLLFGGGRERTAREYRKLPDRAGWQMGPMVTNPGGMSVIEATRPETSPAAP
jgi:hypothetical protein